jgi:hypothetical protein
MRWAGHVARTRKKKNAHVVLCGNLKERDSLKDRIGWGDVIKTNLKNTVGRFVLE